MQWNMWRLLGSKVESGDVDTRALLDDFARLSIRSRTNGPARHARPRIKPAGITSFVVMVATLLCLQQSHMRQQALPCTPAILLAPYIGAARNCTEHVHSTPGDSLQAFPATLSNATPALPEVAVPSGPTSAVQLSAEEPASSVQPVAETTAAAEFAKAGMETVATAPAAGECPNIVTEAGTTNCYQARSVDADVEAICVEPNHTATAAVDSNTAAMQILHTAAAGTAIVATPDLTISPSFASTPEPHLSLTPGMSTAKMLQAVFAHAAETHNSNPADDIAAAALAFKPHCTWWMQGSLSASDIADITAITGAGSPDFEGLFKQLPFISTSRPTAVAATAKFVEASASIIKPAFVATEQAVHSALLQTTR